MSQVNDKKLKLEPCMHCGEEIVPLVRGVSGRAVCTPCGIDRLGPLVFAIRAGCQAGEEYLRSPAPTVKAQGDS